MALNEEISDQEGRFENIKSRYILILEEILYKLNSIGKMTIPVPELPDVDKRPIVRLRIKKGDYSDLENAVRTYFLELFDRSLQEVERITNMDMIEELVNKYLEGRLKKIELLYIGKHQDAKYVTIPNVQLKSGGEKVTVGILIFCLITHYRLKYRLRSGYITESFCLMMDNPFGTASRLDLVKIQVNLANKLNIQLIPFSHIDNKDIYNYFPVFLPLKSEKYRGDENIIEIDKKSKYYKVEASHTAIRQAVKARLRLDNYMEESTNEGRS